MSFLELLIVKAVISMNSDIDQTVWQSQFALKIKKWYLNQVTHWTSQNIKACRTLYNYFHKSR